MPNNRQNDLLEKRMFLEAVQSNGTANKLKKTPHDFLSTAR